MNQFRLLQFVNLSLVSWIQGRGQRDPDSDASAKPQQFPWLNPSDEVWSESWRLTEAQIAMLAMEVERDGAMFVLSATPCCSLDQDGNRIIGGRLQSIADGGGFKFVDLFGDFVEKIQETGRSYLYFDFLGRNGDHWNALGHRVAGTRLANAICGFVFPPTNG